jgi:hypothetical protein
MAMWDVRCGIEEMVRNGEGEKGRKEKNYFKRNFKAV